MLCTNDRLPGTVDGVCGAVPASGDLKGRFTRATPASDLLAGFEGVEVIVVPLCVVRSASSFSERQNSWILSVPKSKTWLENCAVSVGAKPSRESRAGDGAQTGRSDDSAAEVAMVLWFDVTVPFRDRRHS